MEKLEKRINALRAELESLYLRVKAGEPRMEDVIKASGELDRLLLERSGSGGRRAWRFAALEPEKPLHGYPKRP